MTLQPNLPIDRVPPIARETVCCALCGNDTPRLLYTIPLKTKLLSGIWVNGERVEVDGVETIVVCRKCGLQYVNPRWVADGTLIPYTEAMEQAYFASTYAVRRQTYQRLITQLPTWLGRRARNILDVGCGDGVLLEAAHAAGIAATGTELSATLRQFVGEKYGGKIAITETVADIPSTFDVITLINVLEHVAAPHELLAELAEKLNPDGILLVHTPNAGGLPARWQGATWSQIEPLGHLYYFSAQTLGAMLEKAGFEPIGRFHLAVSGRVRGIAQQLMWRVALHLDNGLVMAARRKLPQRKLPQRSGE